MYHYYYYNLEDCLFIYNSGNQIVHRSGMPQLMWRHIIHVPNRILQIHCKKRIHNGDHMQIRCRRVTKTIVFICDRTPKPYSRGRVDISNRDYVV